MHLPCTSSRPYSRPVHDKVMETLDWKLVCKEYRKPVCVYTLEPLVCHKCMHACLRLVIVGYNCKWRHKVQTMSFRFARLLVYTYTDGPRVPHHPPRYLLAPAHNHSNISESSSSSIINMHYISVHVQCMHSNTPSLSSRSSLPTSPRCLLSSRVQHFIPRTRARRFSSKRSVKLVTLKFAIKFKICNLQRKVEGMRKHWYSEWHKKEDTSTSTSGTMCNYYCYYRWLLVKRRLTQLPSW